MFQHLTLCTGLMRMESRHGLVVQLSAEPFFRNTGQVSEPAGWLAHI